MERRRKAEKGHAAVAAFGNAHAEANFCESEIEEQQELAHHEIVILHSAVRTPDAVNRQGRPVTRPKTSWSIQTINYEIVY
ncbi:MAG: hypothetical protein ABF979_16710, partial [Gluconobacter sp.]|uniref:hypothetical protein n=1 Tax=Gluconobacter sp. TaxID=1876758 RepID=UPI0039E8D1DA